MHQPPPRGTAPALAELRAIARVDAHGNEKPVLSVHDRIFARELGPLAAWAAIRLGLSADSVSLASVAAGLAGAAALAFGTAPGDVLAVVLLQFSYLLDCADGDIARANGTASLDGYLRDTFRHYLLGPVIFTGLTLGVWPRHSHPGIMLAGLLGAVFATRLVGDMADRVTLEGLVARLGCGKPSPQSSPVRSAAARSFMDRLKAWFLPDFAIMNWITAAAILDAAWLRAAPAHWLAMDAAFLFLAAVQVAAKTCGLVLLWRKGVAARVEDLAAGIEQKRRD